MWLLLHGTWNVHACATVPSRGHSAMTPSILVCKRDALPLNATCSYQSCPLHIHNIISRCRWGVPLTQEWAKYSMFEPWWSGKFSLWITATPQAGVSVNFLTNCSLWLRFGLTCSSRWSSASWSIQVSLRYISYIIYFVINNITPRRHFLQL